jgi:hypothetical protein
MTHKDSGKYAAKHLSTTELSPLIAQEIEKYSSSGSISCIDAHSISTSLNIEPTDIGVMIDLSEKRISRCQLNLFGHGKGKPENIPAKSIDDGIKKDIYGNLDENKKISCLACWKIADSKGLSKVEITSICEGLEIKITACQLGAF